MGHGHSHDADVDAKVEVGARARGALIGFLVGLGVLALVGLIWLWPTGAEMDASIQKIYDAPGVTYEKGTITGISEDCEAADDGDTEAACQTLQMEMTTGEDAGQMVSVTVSPQTLSVLHQGDVLELARIPTEDGPVYSYSGTDRLPTLIVLTALFVVCVLAVARWKGLFAIIGLGIAAWVLMRFMLPALIVGRPGILVALIGSTVIMYVVLYVAHGISIRTSTALAGTLLGLALSTGLGAVAVHSARLSGFADEMDYDLAQLVGGLNFQELLIVAIIIGGLGVLNDVTITQSSAVWELRAAAPHMTRRQIFASGMRIGRDHIASTIYTIVFAYAGGALVVLLLLFFSNRAALNLLGVEMFGAEAVRTLASAIGLVLAVPITTGIAAITVGPASARRSP